MKLDKKFLNIVAPLNWQKLVTRRNINQVINIPIYIWPFNDQDHINLFSKTNHTLIQTINYLTWKKIGKCIYFNDVQI